MQIENMKTADLKPYSANPRKIPQKAVDAVAASIREFGFLVPLVIDAAGVLVCGHTRLQAAITLKMDSVPCIRADGLTEEQVRAFRIADNSTGTLTSWDWDALRRELADLQLDMAAFGLEMRHDVPLADQIEQAQEWKDTIDQAERNREAIQAKITAMAENHPAAFAGAQAVVISADCSKALIIADPSLKDFLAELQRYAAAGDPSPLSHILEATHPL